MLAGSVRDGIVRADIGSIYLTYMRICSVFRGARNGFDSCNVRDRCFDGFLWIGMMPNTSAPLSSCISTSVQVVMLEPMV